MVEEIKPEISKTVKAIQIKCLSFVTQNSALNVSTIREELPLQFKDQLIVSGSISSQGQAKSKSSQSKSSEEIVLILIAEHLEYFIKSISTLIRDDTRATLIESHFRILKELF